MHRVLLAVTDPLLLKGWRQVLLLRQCTVVVAESGASALVLASQFKPHVAVVESTLPDLSGADLLEALRRLEPRVVCVLLDPSGFNPEVAEMLVQGISVSLAALAAPVDGGADNLGGGTADLLRTGSSATAWPTLVRRSLKLLDERYADPLLDEPAFARLLGTSAGHLHRQLKKHVGRSFLELLHERRTAEAYRLILVSSDTLYQIAAQVGYASATQLRRRFTMRYGLTPRDVRAGRSGIAVT